MWDPERVPRPPRRARASEARSPSRDKFLRLLKSGMTTRISIAGLAAALIAIGGCDSRHCGLPPRVDAGAAADGAVERIAVVLPEAGAADHPDARSDGNDSSVMVGVTFNSCPNI